MKRDLPTSADLVTREFATARAAADGDGRTISGIAVPYDEAVEIWDGFTEIIAHGACKPRLEPVPAFYRHRETIGVIPRHEHTEKGWAIEMRISETQLGNDALTLARDGALTRFSIGFYPLEFTDEIDQDGHITRTVTHAEILEVSLVPQPAYLSATVDEIRETAPRKEAPMNNAPAALTRADVDAAIRDALTPLSDEVRALHLAATAPTTPAVERRSAGELLAAALRDGDDSARQALEAAHRAAWSGATVVDAGADSDHPAWVGDLTRLIDNANPLANYFATGPLPSTGMTVEFGRLKDNTLTVEKQTEEGDTLATGKVSVDTATATVETFGGGSSLSVQAIERGRVNLVDLTLRGLAIAAGQQAADHFATHFEATVKSQLAKAITVNKAATALTWADIVGMIVDADKHYSGLGLSLDGLIVGTATFKALASLTDTTGRPLLAVSGQGVNAVGHVNPRALDGTNLANLRVIHNARQTSDGMGTGVVGTFFNRDAIRTRKSSLARLQDGDIFTLTRDFSVYYYGAFTDEIPTALVPLKLGS